MNATILPKTHVCTYCTRLSYLKVYKIVRRKINDMGRMLYINFFGWITIQNANDLELIELIYEDFIRNGYISSPNTCIHLFS
jgi:hypothetical protein